MKMLNGYMISVKTALHMFCYSHISSFCSSNTTSSYKGIISVFFPRQGWRGNLTTKAKKVAHNGGYNLTLHEPIRATRGFSEGLRASAMW
jgi:hypothetical protein